MALKHFNPALLPRTAYRFVLFTTTASLISGCLLDEVHRPLVLTDLASQMQDQMIARIKFTIELPGATSVVKVGGRLRAVVNLMRPVL